MAIKRSLNPGFAGIDNPLYYKDNTLMLFGDARKMVGSLVAAVEGGSHHWLAEGGGRSPRPPPAGA